jgi:hypothetical protein
MTTKERDGTMAALSRLHGPGTLCHRLRRRPASFKNPAHAGTPRPPFGPFPRGTGIPLRRRTMISPNGPERFFPWFPPSAA